MVKLFKKRTIWPKNNQQNDKHSNDAYFKKIDPHQLFRSIASSTAASNISIIEGWINMVTKGIPSGYLDYIESNSQEGLGYERSKHI